MGRRKLMAGSFIKIEGLDKTLARFDVKKFEPQVQMAFNNFGIRVELAAKQAAPVDEGHLKGAIFQQPERLAVVVGCSVDYAAFLEFGTRRFAAQYVATLPATWQELALRSKGSKGGTFDDLVKRITGWVLRKGIAATPTASGRASKAKSAVAAQHQAAYLIARKIVREGIPAQPFLYPAVNKATPLLLKDLNAIKI